MYRLLHEHVPKTAIVSIAHRPAVARFHDKHLSFESSGRLAKVKVVA